MRLVKQTFIGMDPLDFLTDEELFQFFHCKKTEISCIEQPCILLNQLRDHNLIPEDKYKKVAKAKAKHTMARGVYELLDWLEMKRPETIKLFWRCVFKEHILRQYPLLEIMQKSLLDGSYPERLPDKQEKMEEEEEKKTKKTNEQKEEISVGKHMRNEKAAKRRHEEGESVEEEEEPGPSSSQSTPCRKRKFSKPKFFTPVKGTEEDIWNWPLHKVSLPVSCGNKNGTLDRQKLAKGEKCILADQRWFLPKEFEEFGGKKNCKNWKTSIRCKGTTLEKLIQDGHLKYEKYKPQRCETSQKRQEKRQLFPPRLTEFTVSESQEEVNEAMGGDAGSCNEQIRSLFDASCFSVTCGSATGTLQKNRFARGTCGKCIRTEKKWLTPDEFLKEDPKLTDPHWKISILCMGMPLKDLIEKKVLQDHSLLCTCNLCSLQPVDLLEQENDDSCFICNDDGSLLCCDECPRSFHHGCHVPLVDQNTLGEKWMCTYCILEKTQSWCYPDKVSRQKVLQNRISDSMMQCQYLLLCLYKADEQNIFKDNPNKTVPNYAKFIKNPIWMEKVKEKLQEKEYSTVGQFVSDIQLIFDNCAKFNQGNIFGQIGIKLRETFEEQFQKIFNIH